MNDQEAQQLLDHADVLSKTLSEQAPSIASEINEFLLKRAGSLSDIDRKLLTEGIKQGILIANNRLLRDCYQPLLVSINNTSEKINKEELIEGDPEAISSMNAGSTITLAICTNFSAKDVEQLNL